MTLVITHSVVTGAPADPKAIVDGPAWDAQHVITGTVDPAQMALPVVQYITSGSTVTVGTTDNLIVINKSVGSATTINLPLAQSKVGSVKIVDYKGDASTNNITVNCIGTDTFNGGNTSWVIAADGASLVFNPIISNGLGIGYAV